MTTRCRWALAAVPTLVAPLVLLADHARDPNFTPEAAGRALVSFASFADHVTPCLRCFRRLPKTRCLASSRSSGSCRWGCASALGRRVGRPVGRGARGSDHVAGACVVLQRRRRSDRAPLVPARCVALRARAVGAGPRAAAPRRLLTLGLAVALATGCRRRARPRVPDAGHGGVDDGARRRSRAPPGDPWSHPVGRRGGAAPDRQGARRGLGADVPATRRARLAAAAPR